MQMELITGENDKGRRLDRILRKALPDYPLPLIHRLLRQGKIHVDGKQAQAQDRVDCGCKITIRSLKNPPDIAPSVENVSDRCPAPDILFQGKGLLAVNKPAGLAVHGPGSLDEMIRGFLAGKLPVSLSFKPGPLHRLDKPSSGIVVFSTSIEGARFFSALMRERKIRKTYLAIVEGIILNDDTWEDELTRDVKIKKTFVSGSGTNNVENSGRKHAITRITPVSVKEKRTLIKAEIETGRTHQIRAQAAAHGHPLAGDIKYGAVKHHSGGQVNGGKQAVSFFLHAWKLDFMEYHIEAPPPSVWPVFPEGNISLL